MIKIPYGLDVSVQIKRDLIHDVATVHIHAPLYKNKYWVMDHSYAASEFSDFEILKDSDFVTVILKHYGVVV